MIRRPPRSTLSSSSAASDVYKRQVQHGAEGEPAAAECDAAAPVPSGSGLPALTPEEAQVVDGLWDRYAAASQDGDWTEARLVTKSTRGLPKPVKIHFFHRVKPVEAARKRKQRSAARSRRFADPGTAMQKAFGKQSLPAWLADSVGGDPSVAEMREFCDGMAGYLDEQIGQLSAGTLTPPELLRWELTHLGNSLWYLLHNSDFHKGLRQVLLEKFPFIWDLTASAVPWGSQEPGPVRYSKTDDPVLEDLVYVLRHPHLFGLNSGTQMVTAAQLSAWQRRELGREAPFSKPLNNDNPVRTQNAPHLHPDVLRKRFAGHGLPMGCLLYTSPSPRDS
eukprot:TRINITY_DN24860_c0_g1_i1.p1 TRINITY_DN24860_c0_g1~~TRINITY_DN24860_c0_g1_i1.p1  ORF type:complete len:335 (-),score=53.86 TRINITY_DN24860_c0_g1_i1:180-1184(-)